MWEHLLRGLREIEEAELTAAVFRRRYACDAEAHCDEMMAAYSAKDPRRLAIQRVRRALRWLPTAPAGAEP